MNKKTGIIDLAGMRLAAEGACALLKIMSNMDRLLLLCQLSQGEHCVSDLEEILGIQQPTLSQQLGILRHESLVSTRRDGKQIYYKIASQEAQALMQVLYAQFCNKIS